MKGLACAATILWITVCASAGIGNDRMASLINGVYPSSPEKGYGIYLRQLAVLKDVEFCCENERLIYSNVTSCSDHDTLRVWAEDLYKEAQRYAVEDMPRFVLGCFTAGRIYENVEGVSCGNMVAAATFISLSQSLYEINKVNNLWEYEGKMDHGRIEYSGMLLWLAATGVEYLDKRYDIENRPVFELEELQWCCDKARQTNRSWGRQIRGMADEITSCQAGYAEVKLMVCMASFVNISPKLSDSKD